jgi:hypothetical protein
MKAASIADDGEAGAAALSAAGIGALAGCEAGLVATLAVIGWDL